MNPIVFHGELIQEILSNLSDVDKISLVKTCKLIYEYRKEISFDNYYELTEFNFKEKITKVIWQTHGSIPQNISRLILYQYGGVSNSLPNLTHLTIENYCSNPIDFSLFPSLISFRSGYYFNREIDSNLIPNLKYLSLGKYYSEKIDLSPFVFIRSLATGKYFNGKIDFSKFMFLRKLAIESSMLIDDGTLNRLTHLSLGKYFGHLIDLTQLTSLTHLTLKNSFEKPIDLRTLTSLTNLTIKGGFNQKIKNILPSSLRYLTICASFSESIRESVPSHVELSIDLGKKHCPLLINSLKELYPMTKINFV